MSSLKLSFTFVGPNVPHSCNTVQLKVAERQEEGLRQHKISLEEKARLSRLLPVRSLLETSLLVQQKRAYETRKAQIISKALDDYRWSRISKARYMLEEDNERRQQEEEEEQERLKIIEDERQLLEAAARCRAEREEKEALDKEREVEAERVRKEKAAAMEVIRAEAAEAHRVAAEAAAARKALEPPAPERERDIESTPEEEGEWKKQGPATRVPVSVASTRTDDGASAAWKSSRSSTSTGSGLDNAFGGSAARKPTFGTGGGGGDGGNSGWRGSRGNDAPAPIRGGADWGG